MSFEGITTVSADRAAEIHEHYTPDEIVHARNTAQFKLASRDFGFDVDNEAFFEWEEKHAQAFGHIVDENPDFLIRYLQGDETEVLDEIAQKLYQKHEIAK